MNATEGSQQTVEEEMGTPPKPPIDLPDPHRAREAAYARFTVSLAVWSAAAALVAAVAVLDAFTVYDTVSSPADSPFVLILHAATALSIFAAAVFALGGLWLWRGRISRLEDRYDQWEATRRYERTRTGLVILFGFLAGIWLWILNVMVVPVIAVGTGAVFLALAAWGCWDEMPRSARRSAAYGGTLILVHPVWLFMGLAVGTMATVAGYGLVAYGVLGAWRAVRSRDDQDETPAGDADEVTEA